MCHQQDPLAQSSLQQAHEERQRRSHIIPTTVHEFIEKLHLLAGHLQLGDMPEARERDKVTEEASLPRLCVFCVQNDASQSTLQRSAGFTPEPQQWRCQRNSLVERKLFTLLLSPHLSNIVGVSREHRWSPCRGRSVYR